MKKIISIILSLLLAVSACVIPVCTFAAETTIFTDDEINVSDTVQIPIYVKNGTALLGFGFEVTYDEKVLQPISATSGEVITEGSFDDSIGTEKYSNPFRVVWAGTSTLNNNGELFTLKFKVLESLKTTVTVKAMPNDTYDNDYYNVAVNKLTVTLNDLCQHLYSGVITQPTCLEQGYTTYTCSLCGNSYKGNYVDALGHDFGDNLKKCSRCSTDNPNYKEESDDTENTTKKDDAVKPENTTAQSENKSDITTDKSVIPSDNTSVNIKQIIPSVIKIKKGKKKFNIKWKKISGVDGYQIQYSLKKNMKKAKKKNVSAKKAKFTVKKLKTKKKYYVRIRAYKLINGKKVYSKWSAKKIVKVK